MYSGTVACAMRQKPLKKMPPEIQAKQLYVSLDTSTGQVKTKKQSFLPNL